MVLFSAVVGVDSNFRTLSNCQDQMGTFIPLMIKI